MHACMETWPQFALCTCTRTAQRMEVQPPGRSWWCLTQGTRVMPHLGHFGWKVITETQHQRYLGATLATAFTAEVSAIAWACTWMASVPFLPHTTLHYDCIAAAANAERAAGGKRHPNLVATVNACYRVAGVRGTLCLQHVKAHSSHPWNEYADRAASGVLRGFYEEVDVRFPAPWIVQSDPHYVDWACDLVCGTVLGNQYPPLEAGSWMVVGSEVPEQAPQDYSHAPTVKKQRRKKGDCKSSLPMIVYQANVLTMGQDSESPLETTEKMEAMDSELADRGVVLATVQEARTRGPELREQKNFLAITSGRQMPSTLGCEVWVRKCVTGLDSKQYVVAPEHVLVCHHTPRILVVRVAAPIMNVVVVSAHAPTSYSKKLDKVDFWDTLVAALRSSTKCNDDMIIGIDANAKLGDPSDMTVGTKGAEQEDYSGTRLRELAGEFSLVVVNTFSRCHQGEDRTWRSPNGCKEFRIDYVLVPVGWSEGASTKIDETALIVSKKRDHFALELSLVPAMEPAERLVWRRRAITSRALMEEEGAAEQFATAFGEFRDSPWHTHAHDHHANLVGEARRVVAEVFPVQDAGPNKRWISDDTWSSIRRRSNARTVMNKAQGQAAAFLRRMVFLAWAGRVDPPHRSAYDYLCFVDAQVALCMATLVRTDASHKALVEQDRVVFIMQIQGESAEAAAKHDTKTLHHCVKRLTVRQRRAHHALVDSNLESAATPADTRRVWQGHFARKLAGVVVEFGALLRQSLRYQSVTFEKRVGDIIDISEVPTVTEIAAIIARMKRGRSYGEDALPQELFLMDPTFWAHRLHPIIVKAMLRIEEPLAWKGGALAELYKGAGDRTDPNNSRSVLVSDACSKIYHTWLRARLMKRLSQQIGESFYGGIAGRGTEMCSHQTMMFWDLCRARGLCAAQLFTDVVGAFDAVLRQIIFGDDHFPCDDHSIAVVVRAMGFEPETMHEIAGVIKTGSLMHDLSVPQVLADATAESHKCTWFSTQGLQTIVEARSGSRAGDPLGDVIFSFLEFKIHGEIREELKEGGTTLEVPPLTVEVCPDFHNNSQEVLALENNYVDDDAFGIVASRADALLPNVVSVAVAVARVFKRHALSLNWKTNKTEVIVDLRGRGRVEELRRLTCEQGSMVRIPGNMVSQGSSGAPDIMLRVVSHYKHMGRHAAAKHDMISEAKLRAGTMWNAYRSIRSKVFRHTLVPSQVRIDLANSLLYSRLFHASSLWHSIPRQAWLVVSRAYVAPLREALGMQNTGRVFEKKGGVLTYDAQVFVAAGVCTPQCRVKLARLKYLCRLVAMPSVGLFRMMASLMYVPSTWTSDVFADVREAWEADEELYSKMPDPALHPARWFEYIRQSPRGFYRVMAKQVVRLNAPKVAVAREEEQDDHSPISGEVACPECGKPCIDEANLASHRASQHGVLNALRKYVSGTMCVACGKQFHEYERHYRHIRYNAKCASYCKEHVVPLSDEVVAAVMAAARKTEEERDKRLLRKPAGKSCRTRRAA